MTTCHDVAGELSHAAVADLVLIHFQHSELGQQDFPEVHQAVLSIGLGHSLAPLLLCRTFSSSTSPDSSCLIKCPLCPEVEHRLSRVVGSAREFCFQCLDTRSFGQDLPVPVEPAWRCTSRTHRHQLSWWPRFSFLHGSGLPSVAEPLSASAH